MLSVLSAIFFALSAVHGNIQYEHRIQKEILVISSANQHQEDVMAHAGDDYDGAMDESVWTLQLIIQANNRTEKLHVPTQFSVFHKNFTESLRIEEDALGYLVNGYEHRNGKFIEYGQNLYQKAIDTMQKALKNLPAQPAG